MSHPAQGTCSFCGGDYGDLLGHIATEHGSNTEKEIRALLRAWDNGAGRLTRADVESLAEWIHAHDYRRVSVTELESLRNTIIGLTSAINAALVDLRLSRGTDDHFVQALEQAIMNARAK